MSRNRLPPRLYGENDLAGEATQARRREMDEAFGAAMTQAGIKRTEAKRDESVLLGRKYYAEPLSSCASSAAGWETL